MTIFESHLVLDSSYEVRSCLSSSDCFVLTFKRSVKDEDNEGTETVAGKGETEAEEFDATEKAPEAEDFSGIEEALSEEDSDSSDSSSDDDGGDDDKKGILRRFRKL